MCAGRETHGPDCRLNQQTVYKGMENTESVGLFTNTVGQGFCVILRDTYPAPRDPLLFRALPAKGASIEVRSNRVIRFVAFMV